MRYWNGTAWTDDWAPLEPTPPPQYPPPPPEPTPEPGWYPDPDDPEYERYYDGNQLTNQRRTPEGVGVRRLPTSTTSELPGLVIEENLGVIWATSVRKLGVGTTAAQIKGITQSLRAGVNVRDPRIRENFLSGERGAETYTADLTKVMIMGRLFDKVEARGGNAVVGLRFQQSEMGLEPAAQSIGLNGPKIKPVTMPLIEVVVYGTAVIARKRDTTSSL